MTSMTTLTPGSYVPPLLTLPPAPAHVSTGAGEGERQGDVDRRQGITEGREVLAGDREECRQAERKGQRAGGVRQGSRRCGQGQVDAVHR